MNKSALTEPSSPATSITSRDVALLAGVSQSTVSRILSGKHEGCYSLRTRQRVLDAAQVLGYRPDPFAQGLKGVKTRFLGVVVRESSIPFFNQLGNALHLTAQQLGYQLVYGLVRNDDEQPANILSILDVRYTSGIFLIGDVQGDESLVEQMSHAGQKVVAICCCPCNLPAFSLNTDNWGGVQLLLDHLYDLGHRDFGFISVNSLRFLQDRRHVFLQTVRERGFNTCENWVIEEVHDWIGGYRAMQYILSLRNRPSAVLAVDDMMAIGAIKAAQDSGLHVPGDISITGFDCVDAGQFINPTLTSVCHPVRQIAEHALQKMIGLIGSEDSGENGGYEIFKSQLVVGASSGTVPGSSSSQDMILRKVSTTRGSN